MGVIIFTLSAGALRQRRLLQRVSAVAVTEGKVVDFYELLNVDDDASLEDIKASYR